MNVRTAEFFQVRAWVYVFLMSPPTLPRSRSVWLRRLPSVAIANIAAVSAPQIADPRT